MTAFNTSKTIFDQTLKAYELNSQLTDQIFQLLTLASFWSYYHPQSLFLALFG
jgi:hypothetical protein